MNDGFKQRLVGAIVLLAIALILWPVIFTDPNAIVMDRTSQIPPTPAFEEYPVAKPVRPQNITPVVKPKPEPVAAVTEKPKPKEQAKPKAKAKPKLAGTGLPESWVLQVASFTQPKKADELKQALQKQGYKAYSRSVSTKEGKSTRVYIGPRFSKDEFTKDKTRIDKAYQVKSMVVRFEQ
ncbi:SPOR domain-containing protein [Oceanicoccus sagamiensis]|uniref:SPOR domain-containing protein n=1 Tax=Oceanicoccus sagamiensis TaxID=716816 RepID=A0A1X9NJA2_9GAMM|nr:SPOR domain-containing protein [Oceanicoccus sagamiensis]ARN75925.1 hypothetical protein BST96_18580 [Oceanicoccus sagamiensis]